MTFLVCAAVIATLPVDGTIEDDGSDYAVIDFEVPAGTVEIEVAHAGDAVDNVLDWGLWDPEQFRGWGGGLQDNAVVGANEASRGYIAGPIPEGTWHLVIGKALIKTWPAAYTVTITFRDQETLPVRERMPFAPVELESGQRWYSGDFHVHSRESGDATATFDEIAALARQRGLDFVALSDHNTVAQHALMSAFQAGAYQANVDDVLFVRGAEVTTYGGHGNAFGISGYVDHRVGYQGVSAQSILAEVEAQGGLFSINHPGFTLGDSCIGCQWEHQDTPWDKVHAIEIHTGNYQVAIGLFTQRAVEIWDQRLDQGHRITAIGGSDDHRAGIDISPFQSPIGSPTTMVLADALSEAAILDAVKQGRVLVKLRGPDDPFVDLSAVTDSGQAGTIGDTIAGARVTLETRVLGGQGLDLVVMQNGMEVDRAAIDTDDWTGTFDHDISMAGDRFRVHVADDYDVVITNHIYTEFMATVVEQQDGCACDAGGDAPAPAVMLFGLALLLVQRKRASP